VLLKPTLNSPRPRSHQEFPVVLLKWRLQPRLGNPFCQELYIASSFQSYVRPTFQPELSDFCTSLTGISQATIDAAPEFADVLADFERWLGTHGLDTKAKGEDKDWLWVTDGVRRCDLHPLPSTGTC
jgi:3'-5' exoribonuclease 1